MIVIDSRNYSTYRKILQSTKQEPVCLKCHTKLKDYNKVKTNMQSGITVTDKHRLCNGCNNTNKEHAYLNGRQGE